MARYDFHHRGSQERFRSYCAAVALVSRRRTILRGPRESVSAPIDPGDFCESTETPANRISVSLQTAEMFPPIRAAGHNGQARVQQINTVHRMRSTG